MNKSREKKERPVKKMKKLIEKILLQNEIDEEDRMTYKEGIRSLTYHFRNLHAWNPKLFYLGIFRIVPDMLIPTFAILLPTMVVRGLQEKWNAEKYGGYVGGLMVIMLLFNMLRAWIQTILTEEKENYRFKYMSMLCDKKMDIDYDILETEDFQDKQGAAFHWIAGWTEPVERCISSPGALGSCIIGMLAYGFILVRQSPFILVFIIISIPVNSIMYTRAKCHERVTGKETWKIRRKLNYINNQAMNFSVGKDVRLFGMKEWFLNMYRRLLKQNEKFFGKQQFQYFLVHATDSIMVFLRDVPAYIYLIYQIANGRLTVSDFVLYTALLTGFSMWFGKCEEETLWLIRGALAFHWIRECFEVQNKWKGSAGKADAMAKGEKAVSIEFRDVSFSYHGAEKPTISHINLKIQEGEKLALVGLNGAGKTTLVKLLCGFYHPTEGKILVNGIPIEEYDRDEYYSMISAVFQDAQLLPVSIAKNISCDRTELSEESKIKECLELSGLNEKTEKLSQGDKTLLVRELSSQAIDLSGGEKQKLLLSRALYKEAAFLILDEPTAALDPIAENEIYLKYRDLTAEKTSLFISHRLSSTRFCDRIILLENGEIVEEGTHESLMEAKGRYAHMFEIQSRYYKEEENQKKKLEEGDMLYAI
ncbi:MAG: ABC transporter ATP-binding protein [Bacillota bacterium]|nr:ABC transporter ATP-binding protein [Bacillota bacterium]